MLKKLLAIAVVVSACGGAATTTTSDVPDIPPTTTEEFETHLASLDKPAVVNIWASWCLPCRSEAPLLDEAAEAYGDEIAFIGVAVQDNQPDAKAFLNEFGLADFDHFFDRNRAIPNFYGGIGTPITMFFGPSGDLVTIHNGVVDDRTLALNIDELLQLQG